MAIPYRLEQGNEVEFRTIDAGGSRLAMKKGVALQSDPAASSFFGGTLFFMFLDLLDIRMHLDDTIKPPSVVVLVWLNGGS